ncbi:MAG: hypothetical protein KTR30_21710, partial [Saprospiraceae bacterium]|nr:hypothetical protein [Saprospiraceae bacterium]
MKFNFYFVSLSMLLLICLFTPARSVAQSGFPGGVAGLKHWYNISSSPEQGQAWKDRIGKDGISLQLTDGQYDYLNGNPVLQLNSRLEPIQLPIASSTIDRSTMISLYHAQDTFSEQIIWRMANPSQAGLVLSTHRLGDVSNGRYFKTSAQLALHPILHTYVQHQRGKADAQTANWFIGHTGELGNLPVVQFTGSLPELLIYDRVL